MKPSLGCKLFGAQQALAGIEGCVLLLHSVTGCNFGSLALHLPHQMQNIPQTCTVISDEDVVFGGEASLERALLSVSELYAPKAVFVLSGCVSNMTGEDISAVVSKVSSPDTPVYHLSAPGFQDDFAGGYEQALLMLLDEIYPNPLKSNVPTVNILGLGADDYRLRADIQALKNTLGNSVNVGAILSGCGLEDVRNSSGASLNLVLGRGVRLARQMKARFGIPFEVLDFPYGIYGTQQVADVLKKRLDVSLNLQPSIDMAMARLKTVYGFVQALYAMPAAVIGSGARANGMRAFLEQELGMEVTAFAVREQVCDLDEFYAAAKDSEAAVLFGSSFEKELADELEIPLVRYDYPVVDEICISDSPFAGVEGAVYLTEKIINSIFEARKLRGALYQ